jgi:serine/threonine protein phosphatase 1
MAGRTIAIGDIHGCAAALAALVEVIRPGPDDTLVMLGDYIDRGPDSRGVLDQLIALAGRCQLVPPADPSRRGGRARGTAARRCGCRSSW